MALQSRDRADLRARHATAVHRLFGESGVDMDNASLAEAIDKMVAELPGRLRWAVSAPPDPLPDAGRRRFG